MIKYVIATFILVSILSIIAPNAFSSMIQSLSAFYQEMGFDSAKDISDAYNELKQNIPFLTN